MKKIFLFLFVLSVFKVNGQNSSLSLIPQPAEVKQLSGSFRLSGGTTISYNKSDLKSVAEMLANRINVPTGYSLRVSAGASGSIQLKLNDTPVPQLGNEGYSLDVSAKGVLISANKPAGVYYGMQTFLQLLPKEIESKSKASAQWMAPAVKITDYPRFGWRGIMLDVSRNFFTKEEVKAYIDQISRMKYNTFHWHLTDDNGWRIEIKSLPKLTQVGAWRVPRYGAFGSRAEARPGEAPTVGGFYTQDDVREIIKYAQDRFVTIVPEIDVPGHSMAAIAAYPELSCRKDTNTKVNPGTPFAEWYGNGTFKMFTENTLNPADENVYAFLDKVFTEMAALFPSQYIHVGGDECYKGYWAQDAGCQQLMKKLQIRHVEDLQGYFMNRVEKILKEKGKRLLGWDEILEGGISPDATVMSWRGMKGGIEAAQMGHDVIMTPTTFAYLDYCQGDPTVDPPLYANLRLKKTYSFDPVPDEVDPKHILGGQGNLWTEQLPTFRSIEYMTYPRGWALAEVFWSPKESKNWDNFVKRVETHFERADVAEQNYSKAIYDPIVNVSNRQGKITISLESEVTGLDIYYTIDGTMPDDHSATYTKPFELPEGQVTLRVISYRNGKPAGHLVTLRPDDLKRR